MKVRILDAKIDGNVIDTSDANTVRDLKDERSSLYQQVYKGIQGEVLFLII